MTLLSILAKELKEWPADADYVGQAIDGTLHVNGFGGDKDFVRHTEQKYSLPSDYRQYYHGIVTREEWEQARAEA